MKYDLEQIISTIIAETGLSRKDIEERVKQKQADMKGLINEESATIIVAKALGVDVAARDYALSPTDTDVSALTDGMQSVTVRGVVTQVFPVNTFTRKSGQNAGSQGQVGSFYLRDETGEVRVTLWDELTRAISENMIETGTTIRLTGGNTRMGRNGQLEVHGGRTCRLQISPDDLPDEKFEAPASQQVRVADLNLNLRHVGIRGTVVKKFPPKTFSRKDGGEGQVATLVLRDETGEVRVTFWNDQVTDQFAKVTEGDEIACENLYPKKNFRNPAQIDLNLGKEATVQVVARGELDAGALLQKITAITPTQTVATVEGEVVSSEGLREVNRKDGTTVALFTFKLADDTGVIRVTAWADAATRLAEEVDVGLQFRLENIAVRFSNYTQSVELTVANPDAVQTVAKLDFEPLPESAAAGPAGSGGGGSGAGGAGGFGAPLGVGPRPDIGEVDEGRERDVVELRGQVVRTNIFRYMACPTCRKKPDNCTCNPPSTQFDWKLILTLKIEDDTDSMDVKFFNERAEELLGEYDAALVGEFDDEAFMEFKETVNGQFVGREYLVKGRANFSSFSNRMEMTAFAIEPLDPVKESSRLLAEMKHA